MGAITTLCLSELTDGTDCTAEGEGQEEDEEVEEEEHQLTLPAATVGENQTTDASAELQTLEETLEDFQGLCFSV